MLTIRLFQKKIEMIGNITVMILVGVQVTILIFALWSMWKYRHLYRELIENDREDGQEIRDYWMGLTDGYLATGEKDVRHS